MFPDEITMISGDMPVLERREDGTVWAHPSPWNGKEKIGEEVPVLVTAIRQTSGGRMVFARLA